MLLTMKALHTPGGIQIHYEIFENLDLPENFDEG
jgi:hypothetical protein